MSVGFSRKVFSKPARFEMQPYRKILFEDGTSVTHNLKKILGNKYFMIRYVVSN